VGSGFCNINSRQQLGSIVGLFVAESFLICAITTEALRKIVGRPAYLNSGRALHYLVADSPFGVHLWSSHSRDWVAIIPASDILPWHAREFRLFVGLAAIFYFTAVSTESLVSNVSWQQEKEKEVSSFGVETLVLEIADVVLVVFVFCWLTYFIHVSPWEILFYFVPVTVVNFPERRDDKLELQ
jgi:hypothetical protein